MSFAIGFLLVALRPDPYRNKFSAMIDQIGLQQPAWKELTTTESALNFASMGETW